MSADNQTTRCLKMLEALFRRVLDGLSNKELAVLLGTSPANVTRDAGLLMDAGWVQKLDNGRFALTTRPVALMQCYQLYMADLAASADAFQRRVDAQARQMLS